MNDSQQQKDVAKPHRHGAAPAPHSMPVAPYRVPRRAKRVAAVGGLVLFCFLAAFFGAWLAVMASQQQVAVPASGEGDGNLVLTETERDIAAVVKKVSPSVVSIVTTTPGRSWYEGEQTGAGSGMIVSKDGYVMTNKHVVDGSQRATIVLLDGTTYRDVPVLGADPLNDVAFLKIPDVDNLTPVELGDSKTVRSGQEVIAIGNALGQYQNTVTSGIISGLGRPVSAESQSGSIEELSDLLQTDAAINAGNSGGPLLNMQGQVIGINTAVAADAQNIGFSIPIGATKGMIKGLIATGKVQRAVIGVQYQSITPEVQEEHDLPVGRGDYVTSVSSGQLKSSAAKEAGMRAKDIIIKVNGEEVGSGKSTSTLVGEYRPGDTITLTILRDGKERDVRVTLGAY